MTRFLVAILAGALAVSVCQAQEAQVGERFVVTDIQLQGLQRVSAGTVFNILPVNVGDTMDAVTVREVIRGLFKSGYFDDVTLSRDGGVLIVRVVERPAIESIEIDGNKAIKTESLLESLAEAGLREGEIFKQATLERISIELERTYFAQGRYDATINARSASLPRNRVQIRIDIEEGQSSGVRHINIVGNTVFSQQELLAQLELSHPTLFSFIQGNDKYSKEKVQGDLETLESYYQDRGYVEFTARSVQVSVTPDKSSVYVTVNVQEGDRYVVDDVQLVGELSDVDPDLVNRLFLVREGDVFNRALVTATEERIVNAFGNAGYTFANATGVPEVKENGVVDVRFVVDAGKRAYVRRISFAGNSVTRDDVMRREMRQIEGGWASTQAIDRSKVRLDQLGYFEPESVNVETTPVPATDDQVDVDFTVEEVPTGNINAQLAYAEGPGLMLSLGFRQENVAGTGNRLGASISWSDYQKAASFDFHDPYYTVDGISRGYNVYARETNFHAINVARFSTDSYGAGINFDFPVGEEQRLQFGALVEQTSLGTGLFTSSEISDFIAASGDEFLNVKALGHWSKTTLNHGLFPTAGGRYRLGGLVAVPGSDLEFYRLTLSGERYFPIGRRFAVGLRSEIGYGGVYGDTETYPFYEHFYAGGFGSVRGYEKSSLGPRIEDVGYFSQRGRPFGGNLLVEASAEFIFPLPFGDRLRGVRSAYFFDAGNVFNTECPETSTECLGFDAEEIRVTTGVGVTWLSAMGPMSFALALPLNDKPGDEVERFAFELGYSF
ncbi:MAG: outer membrane protein assembly factor BamA [Gammaproteobacteria bacterium]|nr:outer membrane protein assembly factor BamA [Gammaproteobacteria bacterium]MYF29990.1 outer membrane protein assembly factor BamA [Gammaproteobacteria bacterium]MYK48164.1 outer membrane protein assembly factor BamA [Gammaproteobacteria bacterium]